MNKYDTMITMNRQRSEGRLELLEQQVRELQRENEELKKRNAKLQKAVDRKDLNFIKNL